MSGNVFIKESSTTGSGNVSISFSPGSKWELLEVRVHLSAVGAANSLTITVNDVTGAAYDTNLATQDMSAITDYVYAPDKPHTLFKGDTLDIAWTNGSSVTYGITIVYKLL